MNNFLQFIEKDIDAKKTLIGTLPTRTKTNKKKFNEAIDTTKEKYEKYKENVRNYLLAKSRSFEVKESVPNTNRLKEKIEALEHVKFLLNPSNTYFEKMGFDDLLYQINNYYVFNFNSLNDIINSFLDKFELAGIRLTSDDFNYTCYVHEYVTSFLEVRNKKVKGYEKVSEIFEQIYWINPEIIEHIELNFRKLIKKNEKRFTNYIVKLQRQAMDENKVRNYADCLEKLQDAYIELNLTDKESIADIIAMAKNNEIDINQYLEGSKVRVSAYTSLINENVDFKDKSAMKKICTSLDKLKLNIDEYNSYFEFSPLFEDFKNEYIKLVDDPKKNEYKGLKQIEDQINNKENELEKLNKKIFGGRPGFFEFKTDRDLKQLKAESVLKAKELYELYKIYDKEYFKDKVLSILNRSLSVSDLLHLYYSFDYFKKLAIQKVYNTNIYDEIIKYSDNFDLFAMNPTNIIITGVPVFEEVSIGRIIANKYRLNNIKITEEDLVPENLKPLANKISLILRINKVENSETSIDKIWFMVQVEKIIKEENIEEEI